jgi:glycosyltransferase involved in cell wall biosynthesis
VSDDKTVPDVSVIIPAWDASETVTAAINSALQQTGCTVEVIVVDDESSDDTPAILAGFGDRIRWKRLPNGGPGRSRNRAAALAQGRWLAFLDSDDLWVPGKLASQLKAASESNASVVYTNARNFGDDLPVEETRLTDKECLSGDVFESLLLDNFVTLSGLMVRCDVFEQVGGFAEEIKGTEDWDLLLRLAETETFAVVREPVTLYRWGGASLSKQHDVMMKARRETIERALQSPRGRQLSPRFKRNVWANLWSTAAWFAESGSKKRAVSWYLKSLRWQPLQPGVCKGIVRTLIR